MDSRTIYIGHKEPPPGAEAYIPQRFPDNRIVSSKVSLIQPLNQDVLSKMYCYYYYYYLAIAVSTLDNCIIHVWTHSLPIF